MTAYLINHLRVPGTPKRDDLTYLEIAHTLDIQIGTVMSRLHRARQKLGDQLRDYARREGVIRN